MKKLWGTNDGHKEFPIRMVVDADEDGNVFLSIKQARELKELLSLLIHTPSIASECQVLELRPKAELDVNKRGGVWITDRATSMRLSEIKNRGTHEKRVADAWTEALIRLTSKYAAI